MDKINEDIKDLNNITNQLDLTDNYRRFQPTTGTHTLFLSTHETFIKLRHKWSLNKLNRIVITWSIISDHSGIMLKANNIKIYGKYPKYMGEKEL